MRSVGLALELLLLFAVLVIVSARVAAILAGPETVGQVPGEITAFSVLGVLLYVGMLLIVWAVAIRRCHGSLGDLGFRRFKLLEGVGLVLAFEVAGLLLVASYVTAVTQLGIGWLLPGEQVPDFARQGTGATVFLVLASVIAPLAEETFFRGFVLPAASRAFGFGVGLVLTSVLFGLAHIQPASLVPTFLLGLLLGLLYRLTGSVWPSILMHAANNALVVVAAVLSQSVAP